jgi:hypothetical protein
MNSVEARLEKAQAAQAALDKSPLLGMLAQFVPGIGKRLAKNPLAAGLVESALSKLSGGEPGGNGHQDVNQAPKKLEY